MMPYRPKYTMLTKLRGPKLRPVPVTPVVSVGLELPVATSCQGDLVLPVGRRQGVEVVGEDQGSRLLNFFPSSLYNIGDDSVLSHLVSWILVTSMCNVS